VFQSTQTKIIELNQRFNVIYTIENWVLGLSMICLINLHVHYRLK